MKKHRTMPGALTAALALGVLLTAGCSPPDDANNNGCYDAGNNAAMTAASRPARRISRAGARAGGGAGSPGATAGGDVAGASAPTSSHPSDAAIPQAGTRPPQTR
ncbi:MAG TPA: hypothetical protein VM490_07045 [Armatimonadaceae bacterium]|nr:hypothetical protein [Armatimonadaceae bacterium]